MLGRVSPSAAVAGDGSPPAAPGVRVSDVPRIAAGRADLDVRQLPQSLRYVFDARGVSTLWCGASADGVYFLRQLAPDRSMGADATRSGRRAAGDRYLTRVGGRGERNQNAWRRTVVLTMATKTKS